MMNETSARALLSKLATSGVPPTDLRSASKLLPAFSVGLDNWLDRITNRYLRDLCIGDQHFKLVVAPYGGGKTHFLMSIAGRASAENFTVAFISCIPDKPGTSVRLDNPLGIYQEVAAKLSLPNSASTGIEGLMQTFVDLKRREIEEAGVADIDAAFSMVKRGLSSDMPRAECGDFAHVLRHAVSWVWDPENSDSTYRAALLWLEGRFQSMTKEDWGHLGLKSSSHAHHDKIGRESLAGLVKLSVLAGCTGLVLLIDEVETLFTARGKTLNKILGAMRVMIDRSSATNTPMLCVFSATPDVVPLMAAYPALQQRLAVVGSTFAEGNDYAPQIDLSQIDLDQATLLAQIGERLVSIAAESAPGKIDRQKQLENARRLASVAAKRNLDVDARRLFVKCWAGLLQFQIQTGEQVFELEELSNRYAGDFDSIQKADSEFEA